MRALIGRMTMRCLLTRSALVVLAVLFSMTVRADVFQCAGPNGRPVFQDKPCPGAVPTVPSASSQVGSCEEQIQRWRQAEFDRVRKRQAIPIPAPACMEEENRQRRQRDAAEAAAIAKSKAAAAEYDRKIEQQRADTCGRSPRTRQAILQHKPIIGMTADEARCALDGQFIHVNRTTSVYGVSEQWVIGRGSDTQYLYFNNGILTTIQD